MIIDHINDEQLLSILLENQSITDYEMEGLSGELITLYCMEKLGVDTPFAEVYKEICSLVTSHITENLLKDGLIEAEFGEDGLTYRATPDGEKIVQMCKEFGGDDDQTN